MVYFFFFSSYYVGKSNPQDEQANMNVVKRKNVNLCGCFLHGCHSAADFQILDAAAPLNVTITLTKIVAMIKKVSCNARISVRPFFKEVHLFALLPRVKRWLIDSYILC